MSRISPPQAAASFLALAASPTFAVMALATALLGGPADTVCGAGPVSWPLDGMALMYLLMSAFHISPWLWRRTR